MKQFWSNNKEFRYFAYTLFNAAVIFAGSQLTGISGEYTAIAV